MKRGQLAAVIIIVLLVAAVGGFIIFSDKRAGEATRTLAAAKIAKQPSTFTISKQPTPTAQPYYPPVQQPGTTPSGPVTPSGPQQPPRWFEPGGTGGGTGAGEEIRPEETCEEEGKWIKCQCFSICNTVQGTAKSCEKVEEGKDLKFRIKFGVFYDDRGNTHYTPYDSGNADGRISKNFAGDFSWNCFADTYPYAGSKEFSVYIGSEKCDEKTADKKCKEAAKTECAPSTNLLSAMKECLDRIKGLCKDVKVDGGYPMDCTLVSVIS